MARTTGLPVASAGGYSSLGCMNTNHCYIGPNVPPLGLKRNTIFRTGEMPPGLKDLIKLKPVVRALFVHTKDLPSALFKIERHGSLEHTAKEHMLEVAKTFLKKPIEQDRGDQDRFV